MIVQTKHRSAELHLMPTQRLFGEIPGVPVGSTWPLRGGATAAGVHRPNQAGISGSKGEGADSISVNGGYEDDEDRGDVILYTGGGGRGPSGKQIADQTLDYHGNAALVKSHLDGLPVRVIRGPEGEQPWAPTSGWRYDGLFRVDDYGWTVGQSGFRVIRFRLTRLSDQEAVPYVPPQNLPSGQETPRRAAGVVTRLVRDSSVTRAVKELHEYRCQVCGSQLSVPAGFVAEGAHIQALGKPWNGPDTPDNMLCLCPNHHALFDLGGVWIDEHWHVRDHQGDDLGLLRRHPSHPIDASRVKAHRERFFH